MRSDPDILEYCLGDDDEYLIIATDGFWNELRLEEIQRIISEVKMAMNYGSNPQFVCEKLMEEAMKTKLGKQRRDNMTIIVADLKKHLEMEKLHSVQTLTQKNFFFPNEILE